MSSKVTPREFGRDGISGIVTQQRVLRARLLRLLKFRKFIYNNH